jgi:hypothetical protein
VLLLPALLLLLLVLPPLPLPALLLLLLSQVMSPEVAVVRLLRWAPDRKAAIQLAIQHAELAGQLLATHNQYVPCFGVLCCVVLCRAEGLVVLALLQHTLLVAGGLVVWQLPTPTPTPRAVHRGCLRTACDVGVRSNQTTRPSGACCGVLWRALLRV